MNYSPRTIEKINAAVSNGAEIVENRNPLYKGVRDGYKRVERIAQTNDRMRGYCKRAVWACWK
jgi:hypothetical protein